LRGEVNKIIFTAMKKIYLSILLIVFSHFAKATIFIVDVSDFVFTPSTVNAECGDTVRWVWQNGFHNTTSTFIPGCATPWSSTISSTSTVFEYVLPACIGSYSYVCTFHPGMAGVINVTCATGIDEQASNTSEIKIFPNPFHSTFTLHSTSSMVNGQVIICNSLGEIVHQQIITSANQEVDLKAAPGIYFLKMDEKNASVHKLLVY
jgi:plastocyanin